MIPIEIFENDFILSWRDVAANRQMGLGLELGPAGAAAAADGASVTLEAWLLVGGVETGDTTGPAASRFFWEK